MQYRLLGKTGERVSALGYGCMRLPSLDSPFGGEKIDEEKAIRLILPCRGSRGELSGYRLYVSWRQQRDAGG